MRFAYYSVEGESLCWQRRLVDEGHEVLVYIDKEKGRYAQDAGDGLVPKTRNFDEWLRFGAQRETISFFDFSGRGQIADGLRRAGRLVVGGGAFCDRLEDDRPFGEAFATANGAKAPPSYRFSTISAAISFLKRDPKQRHGDGGWAWKPNKDLGSDATWVDKSTQGMLDWLRLSALPEFGDNNTCLLQEKIAGVAFSTNRWWNGRAWVGPYMATIENKKLMNDNVGSSTGCSFNVVWFYPTMPPIARDLHWEELAESFRKQNAPPGLYDINAIANRQGAWFLEWTPRLGYDSEMTSQRGITNLGHFLAALAMGYDVSQYFDANKIYLGVRITVPPYPVADKDIAENARRKYARITRVLGGADGFWKGHLVASTLAADDKGLRVASESGYVGVIVAAGSSLAGAADDVYAYLKDELSIPNLQYRTDAAKVLQDDLDELASYGWESTPILAESDDEVA